jgi:hypothetical protein
MSRVLHAIPGRCEWAGRWWSDTEDAARLIDGTPRRCKRRPTVILRTADDGQLEEDEMNTSAFCTQHAAIFCREFDAVPA